MTCPGFKSKLVRAQKDFREGRTNRTRFLLGCPPLGCKVSLEGDQDAAAALRKPPSRAQGAASEGWGLGRRSFQTADLRVCLARNPLSRKERAQMSPIWTTLLALQGYQKGAWSS